MTSQLPAPIDFSSVHVRHRMDLDFTIVARPLGHKVEFLLYSIESLEPGSTPGVYDVPCWARKGAQDGMDDTNDLLEAEVYLHGEVKFDGCSNWHFDEQDRVMLHGCSRSDVTRLGEVMGACWDWASELIPIWGGNRGVAALDTTPQP